MRIGTWNCARVLSNKLSLVGRLATDVCVLPEAERNVSGLPEHAKYLWVGRNRNKGLGVLSRKFDIEIDPIMSELWSYFMPLKIDRDRFRLLAVWAFNHRAERHGEGAVGKPLAVFEKLERWLTEKKTIVAGDFNNSVVWDRPRKLTNFSFVNEWLERRGFASAYHSFFKESFGSERSPTHYHLKSPDRPYHIDYIYTNRPQEIGSVEIGSREDWISHSDHVPVVLTRI